MRTFVLLAALTLAACATGSGSGSDGGAGSTAPDCASDDVQRLLTYCASPQAAELARQNIELERAVDRGQAAELLPLTVEGTPVRGPDDAPVTVVMFTDLQCPYCAEAHRSLMKIADDHAIRLVFKHSPLPFHPDAIPAALGALAAREQGKFWEFVDVAYENQDALSQGDLLEYARRLELDVERFKSDFGKKDHIAEMEGDLQLAQELGVGGTPTLFINGVRVVGAYPEEDLREIVVRQEEFVERMRTAGVEDEHVYWRLVAAQYRAPRDARRVPDGEVEAPVQEEPQAIVADVPVGDAPVRGAAPENALVTIVEFADFECAYCSDAADALGDVVDAYPEVRLAYRHFPLPNHPRAEPAAAASIYAARNDKFWELHDLLFQAEHLGPDDIGKLAATVGLDAERAKTALDDDSITAKIAADVELGQDVGVQGTPTVFVNGIMVLGASSREEFEMLIEEQIELARSIREDRGLTGEELYDAVIEANRSMNE